MGFHVSLGECIRLDLGFRCILRAQRGSHIPTLRPKYIPYTYIDPLGMKLAFDGRLVSWA